VLCSSVRTASVALDLVNKRYSGMSLAKCCKQVSLAVNQLRAELFKTGARALCFHREMYRAEKSSRQM
jgi:hypothetical protein